MWRVVVAKWIRLFNAKNFIQIAQNGPVLGAEIARRDDSLSHAVLSNARLVPTASNRFAMARTSVRNHKAETQSHHPGHQSTCAVR